MDRRVIAPAKTALLKWMRRLRASAVTRKMNLVDTVRLKDLKGRFAAVTGILCIFLFLVGMIHVRQSPEPRFIYQIHRQDEITNQPVYHAIGMPETVRKPLKSSFWDPYPHWIYGRGFVETPSFCWDAARYTYKNETGESPWIQDPFPQTFRKRVEENPLSTALGPEMVREVTAYNAGDRNQCDEDPCIDASGENLCEALAMGYKRCAANFVPLGTRLLIETLGEFVVTDRMNTRYADRVDIAMGPDEKARALNFGVQRLRVKIISP